ncbi:MAG: hypothetical protein C5B48_09420 [Candidatus Rokuibacteriota bacterium]|nr:MAG: hypothetical protein C5B48_09420 [Candidatus Rokubacteria bacterium]
MQELLIGLVPGLPASLCKQILERAEGVPLYAVETVRMLLDRGLLVEDGSAYKVIGEIDTLEVPETLHALIAARLDGLAPDERRVLGDAAVLGKTFTPQALAVLSGLEGERLETLLTSMVRREVLGLQSDPRSPEQGQYTFLQDLLRHVAYETLPKRERRQKHLAAAEHLSSALDEDEVAEVIAAHLIDAYRLDPEAVDGQGLRRQAYEALLRAGSRAASLGASAEAQRYFEQSAELADEPTEEAAALSCAGEMAYAAADYSEHARTLFERAIELYEGAGHTHAAARASALIAATEAQLGQVEQAIVRMEQAYASIGEDEPDAALAFLVLRLGRMHFFAGNLDQSAEWTERGLDIAEALQLREQLVFGWDTKALLVSLRRPAEARALFLAALDVALESELYELASRSCSGLSDLGFRVDRYSDSLAHLEQGLTIARRIGNRPSEWFALSEMTYALSMLGRWDEAFTRLAEIPEDRIGKNASLLSPLSGVLELQLQRGHLDEARQLLARYDELYAGNEGDIQVQGGYQAALAAVRLAEGNHRAGLAAAEQAFATRETLGTADQHVKLGLLHALEAALALGDQGKAKELLETVDALPPGLSSPFLQSIGYRFRAHIKGGDPGADSHFTAAATQLRALDLSFHLAVVLLEHGESLTGRGRPDDAQPLLAEARDTFERLQAQPWLDRLDSVAPAAAAGVTA